MNVLARYSGNTGYKLYGLPLWWNGRAEGIFFPGLEEDDLGFTSYLKLGGGLDLVRPTEIMDIKLFRTVGLEASAIIGNNLRGDSVGISLRL